MPEVDGSDGLPRFHRFTQLPFELRSIIWQMAICTDKTPRIHYYSLFNNDNVKRESLLQEMMCAYLPEKPRTVWGTWNPMEDRYFYHVLWSKPEQMGWTKANRFSYFWNAGLRTACKEAHAALSSHISKASPSAYQRRDMVTTRLEGENIYMELGSQRDIICLQSAPEDMEALVHLRWDVLLPRLPFFHLPHASDMNLAMKFDDSWNEGPRTYDTFINQVLSEASPRGVAMRAARAWIKGHIPPWTRMWLICQDVAFDSGGEESDPSDEMRDWERGFGAGYEEFPCKPQNHHVFIDGTCKYIESYKYSQDARTLRKYDPWYYCSEVPVLNFIYKSRRYIQRGYKGPVNGDPCCHFFRVLRPLPQADGTG